MEALRSIEKQIEDYVKNSPQFQSVCAELFDELDYTHSGAVPLGDARRAVDPFFDQIAASLKDFEIDLQKPSEEELAAYLQEADANADRLLTQAEFTDFFARLLKYVAARTARAFAQTYGLGMLGGIVGVMALKRSIKALPVAGLVAAPFLSLVPAVVVGPLVGAAAVYGYRKGDLLLVPKRLAPWAQQALAGLTGSKKDT